MAQSGRFLQNPRESRPNFRQTNCTDHVSKKIIPSKRLDLCILLKTPSFEPTFIGPRLGGTLIRAQSHPNRGWNFCARRQSDTPEVLWKKAPKADQPELVMRNPGSTEGTCEVKGKTPHMSWAFSSPLMPKNVSRRSLPKPSAMLPLELVITNWPCFLLRATGLPLLRSTRVLRRVLEIAFEKVPGRVLRSSCSGF